MHILTVQIEVTAETSLEKSTLKVLVSLQKKLWKANGNSPGNTQVSN
jgi:hypothetical protein